MIQPLKLCVRCGHGFVALNEREVRCETCELATAMHAMAVQRARLCYVLIAGLTLAGGLLALLLSR